MTENIKIDEDDYIFEVYVEDSDGKTGYVYLPTNDLESTLEDLGLKPDAKPWVYEDHYSKIYDPDKTTIYPDYSGIWKHLDEPDRPTEAWKMIRPRGECWERQFDLLAWMILKDKPDLDYLNGIAKEMSYWDERMWDNAHIVLEAKRDDFVVFDTEAWKFVEDISNESYEVCPECENLEDVGRYLVEDLCWFDWAIPPIPYWNDRDRFSKKQLEILKQVVDYEKVAKLVIEQEISFVEYLDVSFAVFYNG